MAIELFSTSAGKRSVERAWLAYTPVWGVITFIVMAGGFAERWGDPELLAFGGALAVGVVLAPTIAIVRGEAATRAHHARIAIAATSAIVVLAFGLNYLQTPYFFDVLHMRYGFHARWVIDRNPIFLYLLTVPYFATYSVLGCIAVRTARQLAPWLGLVTYAIVPFALAFLETVLNASPLMARSFCYDDLPLMLWFGTLSYGVSFVLALPVWLAIGEPCTRPWPIASAIALTLLVVLADAAVLSLLREYVAPHVTTIVEQASGGAGGCLDAR